MSQSVKPRLPHIEAIISSSSRSSGSTRKVPRLYRCRYGNCNTEFYRYTHLAIHYELHHECSDCGKCFGDINLHYCVQRARGLEDEDENFNPATVDSGLFRLKNNVHNGGLYIYTFKVSSRDLPTVIHFIRPDIAKMMKQFIKIYKGIQISLFVNIMLIKESDGKRLDRKFISPYVRTSHEDFIAAKIATILRYLYVSLELYENEGSGWTVLEVTKVTVRILPFRPMIKRGKDLSPSSGTGYIPLPSHLHKKGLINIRTHTERCFMLSVVANFYWYRIYLPESPGVSFEMLDYNQRKRMRRMYENPVSYENIIPSIREEINFQGFESIVSLTDIDKFENVNRISVNVFMIADQQVYPARLSDYKHEKEVDLLLLQEIRDGIEEGHYVLITDIGKFFGKSGYHKIGMCKGCFKPISSNNSRNPQACTPYGHTNVTVPNDPFHKFNSFYSHMNVQYKIIFQLARFTQAYKVNHNDSSSIQYCWILNYYY